MSRKNWMVTFGMAGAVALLAPAVVAAQGRFHGLDKNRDGVITRAEWRGNDTSFRQHDTNRDNVLSGAELKHVPAVTDKSGKKARSVGTTGKSDAKTKAKPSKTAKKAKPKGGRGKGQG